jgi:predicted nucleotidyltransferase
VIDPVVRESIRTELISLLAADARVTGVAVTGSVARDAEDSWSDVDLACGVRTDDDVTAVLDAVERFLRESYGAVDVLPLAFGSTRFRVVLLPGGLQVDVSACPAADFGPRGPSFRLVHGEAGVPAPYAEPDPVHVVGTAWLYALHARTSLARGDLWQALHVIDAMREQVVTLACLRHGLPAVQGRGVDRLPADVRSALAGTLAGALDRDALVAAFDAATSALLTECEHVDPVRAAVLRPVLRDLVAQARSGAGAADPPG